MKYVFLDQQILHPFGAQRSATVDHLLPIKFAMYYLVFEKKSIYFFKK